MNDHHQQEGQETYGSAQSEQRTEPARSRWTPKPEQIHILESVFNSGMVNPPKEETVKIRKMLENFGSVADANVFYWFQNRRARSRRRQRQLRASLMNSDGDSSLPRGGPQDHHNISSTTMSDASPYGGLSGAGGMHYHPMRSSGSGYYAVSGSCGLGVGGGLSYEYGGLYDQGIHEMQHNSSIFEASGSSYDSSIMHDQPGLITVFINGVATEVGRGALDMKSMLGGDLVLYHSSGVPVQVNEYGFLVQSLQHGESYFLVPRQ